MKLVFPGNEHGQVLLGHGMHRIGSEPEMDIVLAGDALAGHHADLLHGPLGVSLRVVDGADAGVNGRPVQGLIALRPGDEITLGGIAARLVAITETAARSQAGPIAPRDAVAATAVRTVTPRHALRGLAGEVFGRTQPVHTALLVGRAEDAGLRLEAAGISRQHARLTPTEEGMVVEDLGSANGTTLNGKRITRELARNGDEIAFDTLRFQVVAPASTQTAAETVVEGTAVPTVPRWVIVLASLIAVLAVIWMMWLR